MKPTYSAKRTEYGGLLFHHETPAIEVHKIQFSFHDLCWRLYKPCLMMHPKPPLPCLSDLRFPFYCLQSQREYSPFLMEVIRYTQPFLFQTTGDKVTQTHNGETRPELVGGQWKMGTCLMLDPSKGSWNEKKEDPLLLDEDMKLEPTENI